ncbi:MAG: OmpH family outer membrane protein [bacterium]|nr:OmpH family outer membrane protein [bacterium]
MRILQIALLLALTFSWSPALEAAGSFKVAVVNMKAAINLSLEGKKSTEYFQKTAQAQEAKFRAQGAEIRKKQESLENNMMLAEEARNQKLQELNGLKRSLQEAVQKAQEEYRKEEMQHLQRIAQEVSLTIKAIGERQGYDLVIESTLQQTLLYSRQPVTDITEEVVTEYNKTKGKH